MSEYKTLQENQSLNAEYERNKKEREMKEEIERLNNIIKEAIEYIENKTTNEKYGNLNGDEWYKKELHLSREELKDLLGIVNKAIGE